MTPTLAKLIDAMTCRECAGEGVLATRVVTVQFNRYVHDAHTHPCGHCGGDGVQPMTGAGDMA